MVPRFFFSTRGAKTERHFGHHFGPLQVQFVPAHPLGHIVGQALLFWQWARHVVHSVPAGKEPLFLNLDETAIAYAFAGLKGCVVKRKKLPIGKQLKAEPVSQWDTRSYISLLAIVTTDPAIQRQMPQILLGSTKLTGRLLASVAGQVPANMHIWRHKTAWTTHDILKQVLALIALHLRPFMEAKHPILVLDMAKSHIHESICASARRLGISLLYVPAKMTWLLQPLDTRVFARLKCRLRQAWHAEQVRSRAGQVSSQDWLLLVCKAVKEVLCGHPWERAFSDVGLTCTMPAVSPGVLRTLGFPVQPPVPEGPLSQTDVQRIFPARMHIRASWFFPELRPIRCAPNRPTALVFTPGPCQPAASHTEGPVFTRTRSRTRLLLEAEAFTLSAPSSTQPRSRDLGSSPSQPPPTEPVPTPPPSRVLPWQLRPRANQPSTASSSRARGAVRSRRTAS